MSLLKMTLGMVWTPVFITNLFHFYDAGSLTAAG